ncbi:MAG: exodeoxyribonuclease III [Proteobacteria bacterium]|nr:exodeoxyribonuclease III [Pseudomonadota bacterium]
MGKKSLKLVSWNVNGLRAVLKKGFFDSLRGMDADVFMVQETKLQEDQRTDDMIHQNGYTSYWSYSTVKKGYSGVAAYSRVEPKAVKAGIGMPEYDDEGRILEMDFGNFILFNVYFPNGQMSDERLSYKLDFYKAFFDYTNDLKNRGRSLIITGDFNTAHNEIDLKHPKANQDRSGFLRIERDWLDQIVKEGYVDTFRYLYPDTVKYSWWTYRFNARANNAGWRIDYFFITEDIIKKGWLKDAFIDNDISGSDHCPVGIVLEIS